MSLQILMEKGRRISLRLSDDLKRRVDDRCFRERIKIQQVGEQLFEDWVGGRKVLLRNRNEQEYTSAKVVRLIEQALRSMEEAKETLTNVHQAGPPASAGTWTPTDSDMQRLGEEVAKALSLGISTAADAPKRHGDEEEDAGENPGLRSGMGGGR